MTLHVKVFLAAVMFPGLAGHAISADVPPASEEYRAQIIEKYRDGCVRGIEDRPSLETQYSHKTIEVFCTCRQRYRADVMAQATDNDERRDFNDERRVFNRAADYAQSKCDYILLKSLEQE